MNVVRVEIDGEKMGKGRSREERERVVSNKSHDRRLCYRGHKQEEGEEEVLEIPAFFRELAQSLSLDISTHCEQNYVPQPPLAPLLLPLHQLPGDTFIHTHTFHRSFFFLLPP